MAESYVYNVKTPDGGFYSGPSSGVPKAPEPARYTLDPSGTTYSPAGGGTTTSAPPVSRYTQAAESLFQEGGAFGALRPYSAEDETRIREQERTRVQSQIDAINELMNVELASARRAGEGRLGETRALSAATGTLGSPRGLAHKEQVRELNLEEESAIRAAAQAKIGTILSGVESRAADIVDKQKTLASTNATAFLDYLGQISERALGDMQALATAGAELSEDQKNRLVEQTGYDPETFDTLYKSMYVANSADVINKDKPIIDEAGGKITYILQKKDPTTGAVSFTTETLDIPVTAQGKKVKQTVNTAEGVQILYEDGTYERIGSVYQAPKAGGAAGGAPSTYTQSLVQQTIDAIDAAIPLVTDLATGISGRFDFPLVGAQKDIPGTPAYNLEQKLETIKANIAFNALNQMREASKTGGALGQVAVRELELLEKTLGSLDIGQGDKIVNENLNTIRASLLRWQQAMGVAPAEEASGGGDDYAAAEAAAVGATVTIDGVQYKKTGDNAYEPI